MAWRMTDYEIRRQKLLKPPEIPLFFKLWFLFVAIVMVAIIFGFIAMLIVGLQEPAAIGRFLGEIVAGFEEAR